LKAWPESPWLLKVRKIHERLLKTKEPDQIALIRLRMERMTGIEPALPAWEAGVLPLNHIRKSFAAAFASDCKSLMFLFMSYCNYTADISMTLCTP
jgi:hypothetical protein